MEFQELLPRRRMVRHYAPEPVSRQALERIVATVRRAPSAGYSQGQRLLVVTDPEKRTELARIMSASGWTTVDDREPWLESAAGPRSGLHARGRLPRALPARGQARRDRWRGDRLAGPVLVRRCRRCADDAPARSHRRGACGRAHRRRGSCGRTDQGACSAFQRMSTIVALVTIGVPAPDPGWSADHEPPHEASARAGGERAAGSAGRASGSRSR